MNQTERRFFNALANTFILVVVLFFGLLGLEFASRVLFPVPSGTAFLDADENVINVYLSPTQLVPDITYRQVSPDFDVLTRIGPMGLRGPEPQSPPEIIFLGDSFTFGQGLGEDQTIPSIYCAQTQTVCANLGFPGSGTYSQARILELWLEKEDWRPAEVKHLVFAMASAITAGNDLYDTVVETNMVEIATFDPSVDGPVAPSGGIAGAMQALLNYRHRVLARSNLARIIMVQIGPELRAWFSPGASPSDLAGGIEAMKTQVARVHALSEARGFQYTIYLIHPMQDLIRGSYDQTADAVREAAAGFAPVVDTAPALLEDPAKYYFPYDGHLNALGAQAIAEFLLSQE
jgi:hypothetical protein